MPVEGAFDRVTVDGLGLFKPSYRQHRYIVIFSDCLTRWCEAFRRSSVEATVIARLLVDEIISKHGAQEFCFWIGEPTFSVSFWQRCARFFKFRK